MGNQCLSPDGRILVRGIFTLGFKGADLLGRPRHCLIHSENCPESASSMGVSGREVLIYLQ